MTADPTPPAAAQIVEIVLRNLMGRRGLRQVFDEIDEDVMTELVESLRADVTAALTAAEEKST